MILEQIERPIERSASFEETGFKVAATAAVMKLLRSAIYSDKETALLRELSANAIDAHVEAGIKDRPIHITLPNFLDPTLKIRDYGKSMTHEIVMTLYATFGISTKGESNDTIGAMGIGKFAPFAYSPSFQLSCIQNKIKRIYNLYLDESEMGRMALLAELETEEENGTELSVPIQQRDIQTFLNKAATLFQFWNPAPITEGNKAYNPITPEYYLLKEGDYGFRKLNMNSYAQSYVVMGGIPYKLEPSSINGLSHIHQNVLNKSIVLFANIGDVEVAASRETLGYTPKTISWIKAKIQAIENSIRAEIDEKVKKVSSEYEARKLYQEIFHATGNLNVLTELLKDSLKINFNGRIIDNITFESPKIARHKDAEKDCDNYVISFKRDRAYMIRTKIESIYSRIDIIGAERPDKTDGKHNLFYDLTQKSRGKLRNIGRFYLSGKAFKENEEIYILQPPSVEYLRFWCFERGIDFKLFKDLNIEVVMPVKVKAARFAGDGPNEYCNCRVYDPEEVIEHEYRSGLMSYTNIDLDETEGGYYMVREGNNFKYGIHDTTRSISNAYGHLLSLDPEFKDNPIIHTFTARTIKKLDPVKWKRVDEEVKRLLGEYWGKLKGDKIYYSNSGLPAMCEEFKNRFDEGKITGNKDLTDLIGLMNWSEDTREKHINLARQFGIYYEAPDEPQKIKEVGDLWQKVIDRLPLLEYINDSDLDKAPVLEYINEKLV